MGVVDANQDGHLDLYTSNHNYQQFLWIADGQGAYNDELSTGGSTKSLSIRPGTVHASPSNGKPGIYIYWLGDSIHVSARLAGPPARIAMHIYSTLEVPRNDGFEIEQMESRPLKIGAGNGNRPNLQHAR